MIKKLRRIVLSGASIISRIPRSKRDLRNYIRRRQGKKAFHASIKRRNRENHFSRMVA